MDERTDRAASEPVTGATAGLRRTLHRLWAGALLAALPGLIAVVPAAALAQTQSGDTSLSALTVSPKDIVGFDANRRFYEVGVAATVSVATVSASANHSAAAVMIAPDDADGDTSGHQVNLSAGRNPVTFTVTAEDSITGVYTVNINRGVTAAYGWKAADDLDGLVAADNGGSRGVWSDDTTMWVADFLNDKLFAYRLADGTRQPTRDLYLDSENVPRAWSDDTTMWVADFLNDKLFAYRLADGTRQPTRDLYLDSENGFATGIWSDDTTMWVADFVDDRLFAYRLADGTRQPTREFGLHSDNGDPVGMWSDDTTVWVSDYVADRLFAYRLADGTRQPTKEIDLHSDNAFCRGIWSDGATIWVAENSDDNVLFAYKLDSGARQSGRDFNTLWATGNGSPSGIWSDGATMWVVDPTDDKVYSYNGPPPPSADASLSALSLSGVTLSPAFASGTTSYRARAANSVSFTMVAAETTQPGATAVVKLGSTVDEDGTVDLAVGSNTVTVEVTSQDGNTTRIYTVTVIRAATQPPPDSGSGGGGGGGGSGGGGGGSGGGGGGGGGGGSGGGGGGGGEEPEEPESAGFVDVAPLSAHASSIDALHAAGITKGCSREPSRFCPDDEVTRAQMASFLMTDPR